MSISVSNIEKAIMWLEPYCFGKPAGGIIRFERAPVSLLRKLMDENLVDDYDRQNNSPSYRELVEFGEKAIKDGGDVTLGGYIVIPSRSDRRVTIDTISGVASLDMLSEVRYIISNADESSIGGGSEDGRVEFYAWWD